MSHLSARVGIGIAASTLVGLGAAGLMLAGPASASVTFDPSCSLASSNNSTGACGFVGKGDVQTAFGWKNATAQDEAANVSFRYDATATYDVTIQFDTGGVKNTTHHTVTQGKDTTVNASVAAGPRQSPSQYTGWNLTGLGTTTTSGDAIPQVGDSCPNGTNCTVTAVQQTGSSSSLSVSDASLGLGPDVLYAG